MVRTQKFGKLDFIGYVNVKKLGGYNALEKLLNENNVDYDIYSVSAKYGKFGGGQVYENDDYIIISTYSRSIHPRNLNLKKIYVYDLYAIKKDDFNKIKGKLPIQEN